MDSRVLTRAFVQNTSIVSRLDYEGRGFLMSFICRYDAVCIYGLSPLLRLPIFLSTMTTTAADFGPPHQPFSPDPRRNRVATWISETNAHSSKSSDLALPHFQQPTHRQRRLAMSSASPPTPSRRPSSTRSISNHALLTKEPRRGSSRRTDTTSSSGSSLHPTSIYTTTVSDENASHSSTAYPALVLLVSCFACAALLPSLLILLAFAVLLTIAPAYDSVQVSLPSPLISKGMFIVPFSQKPQFLPLHRELSVISLETDEDITAEEGHITPERVRRLARRRAV
jgi:hypothetical protein